MRPTSFSYQPLSCFVGFGLLYPERGCKAAKAATATAYPLRVPGTIRVLRQPRNPIRNLIEDHHRLRTDVQPRMLK